MNLNLLKLLFVKESMRNFTLKNKTNSLIHFQERLLLKKFVKIISIII